MTEAKPALSADNHAIATLNGDRVEAIAEALAALRTADADGPALAEILRLVRLMENQPELAAGRLRAAVARLKGVPMAEKIRLDSLLRLGQTEAGLARLGAAERGIVEAEIAADIRRHFGIGFLPAPRQSRPVLNGALP